MQVSGSFKEVKREGVMGVESLRSTTATPRVSIVIATYNHAQFVEAAVLSAVAQSYPMLQVVVADDGSTDSTREIIRRLSSEDTRIVPLVDGPHVGIAANLNRALHVSTGHYIAFCGGDDVMLPGKIAAQVD